MITQELLKEANSLLSINFFTSTQSTEKNFEIKFPLPTSANNLNNFLSSNIDFKNNVKNLIDELDTWAQDNIADFYIFQAKLIKKMGAKENSRHISIKRLATTWEYFKNRCDIDYLILADEFNIGEKNIEDLFVLNSSGIILLAEIIELINNKNIPLNLKSVAVKNLIAVLRSNKCHPELYNHIVSANDKIKAYLSLSHEYRVIRQTILLQIAATIITKAIRVKDRKLNIPKNMECHYARATVNQESDFFNIPLFFDSNIALCREEVLNYLNSIFKKDILQKLSAEVVINYILANLSPDRP